MNLCLMANMDQAAARHPETVVVYQDGSFYRLAPGGLIVADPLTVFLGKLLRAGCRVAVCDQPEETPAEFHARMLAYYRQRQKASIS